MGSVGTPAVLCHLLPPNLVLVCLVACAVKKLERNAGRPARKRVDIVTVSILPSQDLRYQSKIGVLRMGN